MMMETFEILAKKTRRKWTKRGLFISVATLLLFIVTGILVLFGLDYLSTKQYSQLADYYNKQSMIAFPNMSLNGVRSIWTGRLGGYYEASLVKDVNGIPVKYEEIEADFSVFNVQQDIFATLTIPSSSEQGSTEMAYSYKNFQKAALFFNPNAEYGLEDIIEQPAQELSYLPEMEGQLVEVAISFDKQYGFEELEEKIPSNLKVNWYWIGTVDKANTATFSYDKLYGWSPNHQSYEDFYNMLESHYQQFGGDEEVGRDIGAHLQSKGKINKASFGGVILTGKAEHFAQLLNQDWIYASSIGASIPNQPYYQVDVE